MRALVLALPLAVLVQPVACSGGGSSHGSSPDGGSSLRWLRGVLLERLRRKLVLVLRRPRLGVRRRDASASREHLHGRGATRRRVSNPTTVVGTGTAASCTEAALDAAVAKGGVVTFDCGTAPTTITVTAEVPVTVDTTIDGGKLVTLSGGKTTRIMHIKSAWNVATPLLTVQNLTFTDGYTTDVPNTTSTTEGGAAIFEDGGSLTVIDCTFTNNQCATSGEDVSGGAINGQGVGTLIVEGSTFTGNVGSNGGAIGTQDETVTIVEQHVRRQQRHRHRRQPRQRRRRRRDVVRRRA